MTLSAILTDFAVLLFIQMCGYFYIKLEFLVIIIIIIILQIFQHFYTVESKKKHRKSGIIKGFGGYFFNTIVWNFVVRLWWNFLYSCDVSVQTCH